LKITDLRSVEPLLVEFREVRKVGGSRHSLVNVTRL
jgi:hypothetical protein